MSEASSNVVSGVTESGFSFSVDVRALGDIRVVRKIGKMFQEGLNESQQIGYALDAYDCMLGTEQVEALEEHIRAQNDGYCTAEDFEKEITEIIRLARPVKN